MTSKKDNKSKQSVKNAANTKQTILDVALNLFSQRGYEAVSIRDISTAVGIKESSVYYHFENKRAIFVALQDKFVEKCNVLQMRLAEKLTAGNVGNLDNAFFERVCRVHVDGLLMDDFVNAFIKMLSIERFADPHSAALYNKIMIDDPLAYQSGMFAHLIKLGIIPETDSQLLAARYYAPILLYYERYMLSSETTDENKRLFREKAYRHIADFVNN